VGLEQLDGDHREVEHVVLREREQGQTHKDHGEGVRVDPRAHDGIIQEQLEIEQIDDGREEDPDE
jgi:hypothetical protein